MFALLNFASFFGDGSNMVAFRAKVDSLLFVFCNFPALFLHFLPLFPLYEAQDNETNATCCERGCCLCLCIFRCIQKKGPWTNRQKKEGFNFHVIRTLSFFS